MNLSSISLACRDDPNDLTAQAIGHKKHPTFDATKKKVPGIASVILRHDEQAHSQQ
jgi:hypothetical protein